MLMSVLLILAAVFFPGETMAAAHALSPGSARGEARAPRLDLTPLGPLDLKGLGPVETFALEPLTLASGATRRS